MQNLDKIARFEEAINGAAEAEANAILEAAEKKAEQALESADNEFLKESYQAVSAEAKSIKRKISHMVSQKSFEASKELFAYRSGRVEEFFDDLAKEISDYSKTADYVGKLSELLSEIEGQRAFEKDSVIYVKPDDTEKVKKLYPSAKVSADKNIRLGGASVFYPSASIYIDKTFDNAFRQQKAEFVNNSFMQL